MKLTNWFKRSSVAALALAASSLCAQTNVVAVNAPMHTTAKRSGAFSAKFIVEIKQGYHVNSHKPVEDYIIPLRLTWDKNAFEFVETVFPQPKMEKYQFSKELVSVFSGSFEIVSKFKVPANAPQGPGLLSGKLRYQACTETMCLPPKTIDVKMQVETF
jgi:thioredoxin:protein disulfide reductase